MLYWTTGELQMMAEGAPPLDREYSEVLTDLAQRLLAIQSIIEQVDHRCMAADGPVTPTDEEISLQEIQDIYYIATGAAVT